MMKSIKAKLFLSALLTGLVSLILAAVNMYSVTQGSKALATVYENQVEPVSALQDMDRSLKEIRYRMAGILLDQIHATASKKQLEEARVSIPQQWTLFKEKTSANIFSGEARENMEKIDKQLGLLPAFMAKLEAAYSRDDKKNITVLLEDEWPAFQGILNPISLLVSSQQAAVKDTYEKSRAHGDKLIFAGLGAFCISIIITVLLNIALLRSIYRPLNEAIQIAKNVAAGDLTQKIEIASTDEFGQLLQALKYMNESLVRIVGEVRSGTDTIATASSQIAAGNMELSSRTERQASSLEETAASMEELTTTVKQNADNARRANQLAASASEVAVKGGAVVSQVVGTMASINDSSKKIVDIISVIDGIAFQTNILALNAAVEAARAGEQGRGFAVVATEVRNLAQRSAAAAKEIKTLIGDSVDKVAAGSKLVGEAGSTMDEVVASVRRVTDIMSEITAASEEQSTGIEQVNQALVQMDEVTQQNAALVEKAAAGAESLQDQAGNLSQAVGVFRLDGMCAAALATPAIAAARQLQSSRIAAPSRRKRAQFLT